MSSQEGNDFDARDFLCYFLLRELENTQPQQRSITRTQFLKLTCITDRRLNEMYDVDINLPRYWYQYGEILNEEPISNSTYTVKSGEWGGQKVQPAPGVSRDAFAVPSEICKPIFSVVREVAHEFANKDAEEIKDYQYEQYAPNEFIRAFDAFRKFIRTQDNQSTSLADFSTGSMQSPSDRAKELLDNVTGEYPTEVYSDTYRTFIRWEDTTRLLLAEDDFETTEELADDFWETLSKVELRFRHGQNTPESQEIKWANERGETLEKFRVRLTELRENILTKREPSKVFQSLTQSDLPEDPI